MHSIFPCRNTGQLNFGDKTLNIFSTNEIINSITRFLFLILIIFTYSCNSGQSDSLLSIDLSGTWKVLPNDDQKFSDVNYDDSKAKDFKLPGTWIDILRKNDDYAATIWIRQKVVIDKNFSKYPLILSMGHIGIADEVYFNGVRIGGTGQIPHRSNTLKYKLAWKNPRHYFIPETIINFDSENCIAIRIFSHVFNGISGKQQIVAQTDGHPHQLLNDYIPLIISYLALILNFTFLAIFLILFMANRNRIIYIYFSLVVLTSVLFNLPFLNLPFSVDGLTRIKIILLSYTAINFFLLLSAQKLLLIEFKSALIAASGMLTFLCVFVFFSPTTKVLIEYCGFIAVLFVLIWQMYILFIFYIALNMESNRYWLLFLIAPVMLSAFRNAYYLLFMDFVKVQNTIFLHVPITISIIIVFFLFDYEYEKKSGESIYKSLLYKSNRLQRDLERAKKIDAKPKPDEIIHELIGYLNDNFQETYKRKELAAKFSLNENYMVQLFKRTTGTTISKYINTKRIEHAKNLLLDTNDQIIDIAYKVGYHNITFFNRLFKQETGMSPRKYRKSNNDN